MILRKTRLAGAVLLAVLLSACSAGLKSSAPPEQLYVLRPAAPVVMTGPRVEATLQLLRPVAQPGLGTARIALLRPGNRLDYYADGRWSGPLVDVMESLLAQTLRGSGRFAQVSSDAAGMGADFALAVTLRRFEAEYAAADGPPTARVVLECTLSSRREHRQIEGFNVEASVPAQANRLGSVVLAFEQAAGEAVAGAIDRTAQLSSAALAAEPREVPKK